MRPTPALLGTEAKKRAQRVNHVSNGDAYPSSSTAKGEVGINVVRFDSRQRPSKRTIPSQKLTDCAMEAVNGGGTKTALLLCPGAVFV
jgi:hypothetical protein